jgi:hypothetical protein
MSQSLNPFGHSMALTGLEDIYLTAQHLSGSVTKRVLKDVEKELGKELGEHLPSALGALKGEITHIHIHPLGGLSLVDRCINDAYALSTALIERIFPHVGAALGVPPRKPAMSLEYPRPDEKVKQVVLVHDRETHMLQWAKQVPGASSPKTEGEHGIVYAIPIIASVESDLKRLELRASALARFFPSLKLPWRAREQDLFVLRFEPLDKTVEAVEHILRPYALWHFSRDSYADSVFKEREKRLPESFWKGKPRALGFIHGTVDRCSSCFGSDSPMRGAITPELVDHLTRLYDGQMFAFDHPTATVLPDQNADWLIKNLPTPTSPVTLDLVAHSRGGLVARALRTKDRALKEKKITLGKIVYVGTPNAGTNLVDPKRDEARLGEVLITIYTNIFSNLGGEEAKRGLQFLAHVIALTIGIPMAELPGFAAMAPAPNDAFLKLLNATPPEQRPDDFAIAAEWDPGQTTRDRILSMIDKMVRPIHTPHLNDLVVPTDGVGGPLTPGYFQIAEKRTMRFSSKLDVYHLSYFGRPETHEKMLEWLAGELNAAPAVQPTK